LRIVAAPAIKTNAPIQSPRDQPVRHARIRSDPHPQKRAARSSTPGITASWPRTAGAIRAVMIEAPIRQRVLRVSAFAIRKKHRAAYGYASGSSTRNEE